MSRLADLPVELRHAVIEAIQQPGLIRARNGPRVAGDTCSLLALACTSTYWRTEVMIFIEDSAIGGRGRGSGFVITMDAHAGPWHGRQDLPIKPSINPSINPVLLCSRVLHSLRWVGVSELNLKTLPATSAPAWWTARRRRYQSRRFVPARGRGGGRHARRSAVRT